MTAFELSNIVQRFDEKTVLAIDSLNIESGGIFALLGPNGAGKSTLLNILGLLEPPVSGTLQFFGEPVVYRESVLQKYRKQVVLVSQNPILFTKTVFKNMAFGLKLRQFSPAQRIRIIEESLDLVGMRHYMQARAHKLSGGETQRVAIARALALSPRVLLCDEPTASVDLEHQSIVVDLLRQINEEKKITIIFTSHDRLQATNLAQRVIFLDHGQISHAPYENLFTATIIADKDLQSRCRIQGKFDLSMNKAKTGDARILIDPNQININRNPDHTLPDNSMIGEVAQITAESGTVRIIVDSILRLDVLIPAHQYQTEKILVGDRVQLSISKDAIRVLN